MRVLKFLLRKEFLQIRRNPMLIRIICAMPIIQLAILPWAATFEQRNIKLTLVDNDKSSYSHQLREKVISSGFFLLADYNNNATKAIETLDKGESDIVLEIPRNFEKNIVNRVSTTLFATLDAVNGQKAGLGMFYITRIMQDYNLDISNAPTQRGNVVNIKPYYRYNQSMNYQNFMVPGILVILVTVIGSTFSALNIVREKEIGTIEQINATPISKGTFILGKLIPFWIIGLALLTFGMLVARLVYGLVPLGGIQNIYIFAFFYLLAFTGFGLTISNYTNNQQQAMFVAFFFLIIFILLSGLFTPISSMPEWAQTITIFNPLRYFVDTIRLIYMKGSGFMDILPNLLKICVFVVVFNLSAILSYRKTTG